MSTIEWRRWSVMDAEWHWHPECDDWPTMTDREQQHLPAGRQPRTGDELCSTCEDLENDQRQSA